MIKLMVGDIIRLRGELLEVVKINPHQDIPDAVYYKLSNGLEERDARLHPEKIYREVVDNESMLEKSKE